MPLAGISNTVTLLCNENGELSATEATSAGSQRFNADVAVGSP